MTLTSLWQDRHPATTTGPPTVGGDWDVVVVGGGLTGLTTALLLARAGKRVVVVEARHLGFGTTGRSTAKVSVLQGTRLSTIATRQSPEVVRKYVQANLEGQAWLRRFCEVHAVAFQARTAYTYAHGVSGVDSIRREQSAATDAGLPVTWVERPSLPFPTAGAIALADQFQVDPMELLAALAAEAVGHGATIVEGARVQKVTGRGPVRVVTEHGEARAGQVVVATNMPILDRGGFFARAEPSRSYGLAFRTATPAVEGMWLSADSPSRSLRDVPSADGDLLLVGGEGHTTGRAGSTRARLDALRAWTADHFPGVEETHAWSAQDYVPHHGVPYVGPLLPGREEILVAGGYAKWGMTNAVAASLALSGRMLDGHMEWATALEPWHAPELRGLLEAARINGEVGVAMAAGWLRPLLRSGPRVPPEGEGQVRMDRVGSPTAVARVGGGARPLSAVCTHLGGVVSWNDAERSWDCPLHGSRFDGDGEVLEGPAVCGLTRR